MVNCKLLSHTPEPEQVVAAAARLCYSTAGAGELHERLERLEVERLIRHLREVGHTSPFEHASFTFAIEGVSRSLTHQLVRHRMASYSQQSQRYVDESRFEHIVPPSIACCDAAKAVFVQAMNDANEAYRQLVESGIPREDARYVLPNACETKIVVTLNARALLNFLAHRTCTRAQWEIRQLAAIMLMQVRGVAPVLFEVAGPPCETDGVCHEGTRSCGRLERERNHRGSKCTKGPKDMDLRQ